MKNKTTFYIILSVILILIIIWAGLYFVRKTPLNVLNFQDCVSAGYPVMESYPRQCKTPDGRVYAEEIIEKITYNNSSEDLISVELPFPGAVVGKEFSIIGKARGFWYFEASFPIKIIDKNGDILTMAIAQAQNDWMTEDFVPFRVEIKIPEYYIGEAVIVFEKDNPSGIKDYDASMSFPITIEY